MLAALAGAAFAQAYRFERGHHGKALPPWLFSRRNGILLGLPFALFAAWTACIVGVLLYAALSFFFVQYVVHRLSPELTTH
jgi:hypothetical protein